MFTWLLILWAAVTFGFIVVMIWKAFAGQKEEDIVILDPAEEGKAAEQRQTVAKVERLAVWAKGFGFTSLGLLILVGGISLFRALHAFSGGGQ